jgi:hypothetical protein
VDACRFGGHVQTLKQWYLVNPGNHIASGTLTSVVWTTKLEKLTYKLKIPEMEAKLQHNMSKTWQKFVV